MAADIGRAGPWTGGMRMTGEGAAAVGAPDHRLARFTWNSDDLGQPFPHAAARPRFEGDFGPDFSLSVRFVGQPRTRWCAIVVRSLVRDELGRRFGRWRGHQRGACPDGLDLRSWVLFARPRAVRLAIAKEENRLEFRVFSTSTLQEMAAFQPTSLDGLMDVWSMDGAKDKRCGWRFPDAIVGETD